MHTETEEEYLERFKKREEIEARIKAMMEAKTRREERRKLAREYKDQIKAIMPRQIYIKRLRELLPLLQNPNNEREYIAKMLRVNRQTLYNWITTLKKNGFSIPERKRGKFAPPL